MSSSYDRDSVDWLWLLHHFLTSPSVSALLKVHPNDIQSGISPVPQEWSDWWTWASLISTGNNDHGPLDLILEHYYSSSPGHNNPSSHQECCELPESLKILLDRSKALQRPRDPILLPPTTDSVAEKRSRPLGQSPKKIHEVERMIAFLDATFLSTIPVEALSKLRITNARRLCRTEGYLTRSLALLLQSKVPGTGVKRILAIDSDGHQTSGAKRWEQATNRGGKSRSDQDAESLIEYRTIHLNAEGLMACLDNWIGIYAAEDSTPILFVALHACGSLTPSILRSIAQSSKCGREKPWYCIGAAVVGCCYNLLEAEDFPLSRKLCTHFRPSESGTLKYPVLPSSAYHLATQAPDTYYLSERSRADFHLSIQKVVWRAMLAGALPALQTSTTVSSSSSSPTPFADNGEPSFRRVSKLGISGTGLLPVASRLGKLNDKAYISWPSFIEAAGMKMGFEPDAFPIPRDMMRESQLAVLQVLRCLIGPVVETLFLEDRACWLKEEMGELDDDTEVSLVNLFDQSTGSARNVGIIFGPRKDSLC